MPDEVGGIAAELVDTQAARMSLQAGIGCFEFAQQAAAAAAESVGPAASVCACNLSAAAECAAPAVAVGASAGRSLPGHYCHLVAAPRNCCCQACHFPESCLHLSGHHPAAEAHVATHCASEQMTLPWNSPAILLGKEKGEYGGGTCLRRPNARSRRTLHKFAVYIPGIEIRLPVSTCWPVVSCFMMRPRLGPGITSSTSSAGI